jgi:hypothetical protein
MGIVLSKIRDVKQEQTQLKPIVKHYLSVASVGFTSFCVTLASKTSDRGWLWLTLLLGVGAIGGAILAIKLYQTPDKI